MAPPSYARATASSTSKASPKSAKVKDTELPTSIRSLSQETSTKSEKSSTSDRHLKKTLKRPSLLTSEERDTIAYKRDLYPIKPKDPSKPCPLATLPSELRCHIYTFLLPSTHHISDSWARHKQHLPPPLTHVCRALRIEASYTYYTVTYFLFTVRNLNFEPVRKWVDSLPKAHRALLAKNKGMEINIIPRVKGTYTYPPPKYLIDDYVSNHWKACKQFGNIYTICGDTHKKHFIIFCRLASWWTWCSRAPNKHILWTYSHAIYGPYQLEALTSVLMPLFLRDHVSVLAEPCVNRALKKRGNVLSMRTMAIQWLDALDRSYEELGVNERTDWDHLDEKEWHDTMEGIRKAVERW